MGVALSFVAGLLLCLGVLFGVSGRRRAFETRVAAVTRSMGASASPAVAPEDGGTVRMARAYGSPPVGRLVRLRERAAKAGLGWPAGAARRRLYLALGLLALLGVVSRGVVLPIAGIVSLAALQRVLAARRRARRTQEFESALPDMLTITSGALRSGYSFLQAVDMLTTETKGRMAEEFRIVLREMTLGVGVEDAMTHAAARVQSKDFTLIVDAVLIQRQIGGNLAEVLDIVADTIRERTRLQGEIRSLTAQGRMSMWIFLLLTPGITLVLFALDPSYISLLWSSPPGLAMAGMAVLGQVVGGLVIRRIVSIEI